MKLSDAFILAVVQGITEWLPISSSGHLILFHYLFGLKGDMSFDIFLHFSALFVIPVFFKEDIRSITKALIDSGKKSSEYHFVIYILCATCITAVIGIFLRPYMDCLATIKILPYTFLVTSLILFASGMKKGSEEITMKKALFIGLMQGFALLPGISRSGTTIAAAKMAGVKNQEAFRFSFLLAIPSILGAILLDIKDLRFLPLPILGIGFFTSLFLGLVSLLFLRRIFLRDKFHLFGFYTFVLSILLFFFS